MLSKFLSPVAQLLTLLLAVGVSLPAVLPTDDPPPPEEPPDPVAECIGCNGITSPGNGIPEVYDPTNDFYVRLAVQVVFGSCTENEDPNVQSPCAGTPCNVTVASNWRVVAGSAGETCLVLPPADPDGELPEPHCYQRVGTGDDQGVSRTQPLACLSKLNTYRLSGQLPNLGTTKVHVQAKCTRCELVLQSH